ncbi:uncharacterized protein I206_105502 [Kwoniella pini CBS 10737]|uniref:Uncharacterized protein n=1 Tax=Kwoniella pini CBS 10737 TaxID=1296096 RepID=A0A1B9I437_9TREE|nr:uncharacterized protein I206_03595 [Kwoniella pini CBS 10737]OCF50276.1 hypothetical protein I206_03595 [Kwoniella pini CBS 10737]
MPSNIMDNRPDVTSPSNMCKCDESLKRSKTVKTTSDNISDTSILGIFTFGGLACLSNFCVFLSFESKTIEPTWFSTGTMIFSLLSIGVVLSETPIMSCHAPICPCYRIQYWTEEQIIFRICGFLLLLFNLGIYYLI